MKNSRDWSPGLDTMPHMLRSPHQAFSCEFIHRNPGKCSILLIQRRWSPKCLFVNHVSQPQHYRCVGPGDSTVVLPWAGAVEYWAAALTRPIGASCIPQVVFPSQMLPDPHQRYPIHIVISFFIIFSKDLILQPSPHPKSIEVSVMVEMFSPYLGCLFTTLESWVLEMS